MENGIVNIRRERGGKQSEYNPKLYVKIKMISSPL